MKNSDKLWLGAKKYHITVSRDNKFPIPLDHIWLCYCWQCPLIGRGSSPKAAWEALQRIKRIAYAGGNIL